MILERSENLAGLVGVFLTRGLLGDRLLAILIDKERYEYIDHVVTLIKLIFDIDPTVTEYHKKALISISDRAAIEAFKRDALEIDLNASVFILGGLFVRKEEFDQAIELIDNTEYYDDDEDYDIIQES